MVDLFLTKHLVLVSCEVPRKIAARSDVFLLFFICLLYLCSFKHRLTVRNSSSYVKIWSSLSMLRRKNIFAKNQKQNKRHCVTCYVTFMVHTLIDHSSRPISSEDSLSYSKIKDGCLPFRKCFRKIQLESK